MFLGLHWLDWSVLVVYLLSVTVLGVMAARKVKNMDDFFMGGRRFGKFFMMFFAFGAGTSSDQASSVVAGTWRVGLAGIWWQFLWLWATPFYWIIAPLMRRMRALTTSDFFEARFNSSTATLYSIWGMIMAIVMIAGALYGSGKMVDALTGNQLTTVADQSWIKDYHFIPVISSKSEVVKINSSQKPAANDEQNKPVQEPLEKIVKENENPILFETSGFQVQVRAIAGYEIAILIITILFVTYGMAGGLGAAIWTDAIQGVLTIVFSFLLLPFIFAKIGGFSQLNPAGQQEIKPGMFDLVASPEVAEMLGREPITFFYIFMLSLTALTGILVQPHIMGVCGAGKTEFEGRFGFTFGNFIKRFCTLAWTFTALACVVWYLGEQSPLKNSENPTERETFQKLSEVNKKEFQELSAEKQKELKDFDKEFADRLFGRAAYDILPTISYGLVGLLIASLLAAMMSTCDAQMIVASGLFTENIYRRYLKPKATQKHYLTIGRFSGLLIVILALLLQTTFTDVIGALKVIVKTPAIIGISLWMGVMWRGWTSAAVWVSSIVASAVWGLLAYPPQWLLNIDFLDFMFRESGGKMAVSDVWTMVAFMSAGVLSGIVTSLLTQRPAKEKLDEFFLLMRTPVQAGEVVDSPCTMPQNPSPPLEKMFKHPDLEIPRLNKTDLIGFALAWVLVAILIYLTKWLAS